MPAEIDYGDRCDRCGFFPTDPEPRARNEWRCFECPDCGRWLEQGVDL